MQKLFRLTALLIAAMLVVWVVGCGDDEEEEEEGTVAKVTEVEPEDGSTVASNTRITVTFDKAPEDSVKINDKAATLSGKEASVDDVGLTEGENITVEITWTNKDGTTDSHSVDYTVGSPDNDPPTLVSSTPAEGTTVDPDPVNTDGIVIEFADATGIDTNETVITVTVADTPFNWMIAGWENMTATLLPISGNELRYDQPVAVEITVVDPVGNSNDYTIEFSTMGKED